MLTLERRALRVEDIYPDEEDQRLQLILQSAYRRVLRDLHAIVGEAFDLDPTDFRLPDATAQAWAAEHAAAQVTAISSTTRDALRTLIAESIADGRSTAEVIQGVEDLYLTQWRNRPEVIARTEVGTAQLASAEDRYRASGLVDRVKIRDGDQDEPCASQNGTTVPLGEQGGLNHPQCTKFIIPLLREGVV